jgi:formylglycine-generating enzyme required for sulfatase activity
MAFDLLFWLLIAMLAVVAYAIEAGLAVRHRSAVLGTLFSVIGAILYIMLVGDENSFGRAGAAPSFGSLPTIDLPKVEDVPIDLSGLRVPDVLTKAAPRKPDITIPNGPFTDCDGCPSMIAVLAGSYDMGSPPNEPGRLETEGPVRIVLDYPFAVGRFEVTRDQFAAFVSDARHAASSGCQVNGRYSGSANWQRPGFEQTGTHPVVCINWRDARAYTTWLSKKTKKTYRLLSESEWEYMARGGTTTAYASGDRLSSANGNFNRMRDGTIPIGFGGANAFGIYDVHGNAWELVEDCWNDDLQLNDFNGRATMMRGDCSQRVMRGGGWDSSAAQARVAARGHIDPGVASNAIGFRVARVLD